MPRGRLARIRSRLLARRHELFAVIGACLVLALGFETVQLPVKAQVLPLTAVLAVLLLPLVLPLSGRPVATPLFRIVSAFCAYAAIHSLVALGLDTWLAGSNPARIIAWARQLAALAAGFSTFFVLRTTMVALSARRVAGTVVGAASPGVLLALLNVLWGVGVWPDAGKIVWTARLLAVPRGLVVPWYFTQPTRAAGFCFEPAHFAFFLAVVVLPPTLALLIATKKHRWLAGVVLGAEMVSFFWAFSPTGYLVLIGMLAVLGFGKRFRRQAIVGLAGLAVMVAVLVLLFPSNYFVYQAHNLWSGLQSHGQEGFLPSVTAPVFATFGPFARAFSSLNLLGYGLGGTATHLAAMVPAAGQAVLTAASWTGMPTLTTSLGRVFAETGLVGLLLFAGMWLMAFRAIARLRPAATGGRAATAMLGAASLALVGLAIGHTVKFGSFALPYLWFWLAYVDSRTLFRTTRVEESLDIPNRRIGE
jgi:hypothetical protein